MRTLALSAALVIVGSAQAQTPAPMPEALKPARVAGPGLNVRDLEASKVWYQTHLGMRVIFTVPRDGKPYEHIMGYAEGGPVLALVAAPQAAAWPKTWGRVILEAPDGRALSQRLNQTGVPTRELVPGVAYFLADPDGNPIELYTPPKR